MVVKSYSPIWKLILMKGSIPTCLKRMTVAHFGKESWEETLENIGISKYTVFPVIDNIDDLTVIKIIKELCQVLAISPTQLADRFGDYWVNTYSQEAYSRYYSKYQCAMDFLLGMDELHQQITYQIKNAQPPRFSYQVEADNIMIMEYKSHRNLIDLMIGLIKGVGKYYHEELQVTQLAENKVRIIFPYSDFVKPMVIGRG